jgi:DNA-binding beta-propeller fold protein YncE
MRKPMYFVAALSAGAILLLSDIAHTAQPYALVTGRRDPRIYAINLTAALQPQNNNTGNAIVARTLVNPARYDGKLLGDPANIIVSEDQKTAYVMNHHGAVVNAEFLQHGGRGNISVMDVAKMLKRENDNSVEALLAVYDVGWFGGVGLALLPNAIIASAGEGWLAEAGSNRISIIDRKTGGLRGQIQMPLTGPGVRQLRAGCPSWPVPFVSPTPPPVVPILAPDPAYGCFPDPEGIALGKGSDGKTYLFSGNGGTDDVAVMDVERALAGASIVEAGPRIPVQSGPFGINASPNGKYIAVTGRESHLSDFEGNTMSIIDVDIARQGLPGAEAARVQVGTDNPSEQVRPFWTAWTPDGHRIVVTNYRANSVSVVDLKLALARDDKAEIARIALSRPDGQPARPKGIAVTPDGRHVIVTGGPNTITASATNLTGMLHIVDLVAHTQVATVTGVGIDPYGLVIVNAIDGD